MATVSELFSYLIYLHITKFISLSIFTGRDDYFENLGEITVLVCEMFFFFLFLSMAKKHHVLKLSSNDNNSCCTLIRNITVRK